MDPSSFLPKQSNNLPKQFVWAPEAEDLVRSGEVLMGPVVDLHGFFTDDEVAIQRMVETMRAASLSHGCFQVINHGIDSHLISAAYDHMDRFFQLPTSQKLKARKIVRSNSWGYSGKYAKLFSSNLQWKETLSLCHGSDPNATIDFFKSTLEDDFEQMGKIYQKYGEAMKELALSLMELLAISLGINRLHFKKFFKDGCSMVRCNFYPTCEDPSLTFGTGPHRDPTSLTILHQDQVGGLEVFANNAWWAVRPRTNALVIMIGDTFSALTNGKYKSCLHRALVYSDKVRRSLVFFLCPREDKVVRPPEDLVHGEAGRAYPDFTWSDLLLFTQKLYRADAHTLHNFIKWFLSSNYKPPVDDQRIMP